MASPDVLLTLLDCKVYLYLFGEAKPAQEWSHLLNKDILSGTLHDLKTLMLEKVKDKCVKYKIDEVTVEEVRVLKLKKKSEGRGRTVVDKSYYMKDDTDWIIGKALLNEPSVQSELEGEIIYIICVKYIASMILSAIQASTLFRA